MENYVLIDTDDNSYCQLDSCYAKSLDSAETEFCIRGWVTGKVMTYWEYQGTLQNECELNSLENQTYE